MKLIAAVSKNWAIGKNNSLLFSIPTDMAFFRKTTSGKTIIMGRKTLDSFPGSKPLKNRKNVVLSKGIKDIEGATVVSCIEDALKEADSDTFVIGGESIYTQFLPYCDTAYITKVFEECDGDAFFPDLDKNPEWYLAEAGEEIEENGHKFSFCTYNRKEATK